MKRLQTGLILYLGFSALQSAPTGFPGANPETQKLADYVKHLGNYLGYDLKNYPAATQTPPSIESPAAGISEQLLDVKRLELTTQSAAQTYLGALPITTSNNQGTPLVPNSPILNQRLNTTFSSFAQGASSGTAGTVSVIANIDQKPYQQDPVSQTLLNLLSTPPDPLTCAAISGSTTPNASCLNVQSILGQVIVTPQSTPAFFDSLQVIPQLNSDTLLSPLLYTSTTTTSSTSSPTTQTTTGLPAQSTAQLAADFIRYASGTIIPLTLPSQPILSNLITAQATLTSSSSTSAAQASAQSTITAFNQYTTGLRIYAAQVSVGLSNLYYLLSKRLPQADSEGKPTSQALSEYNMATWRLFTLDKDNTQKANNQWTEAINTASAATIQKEMVTLLAEINYQLYLTRQQQERLLLTNTTLLLMNAKSTAPTVSSLTSGSSGGQ